MKEIKYPELKNRVIVFNVEGFDMPWEAELDKHGRIEKIRDTDDGEEYTIGDLEINVSQEAVDDILDSLESTCDEILEKHQESLDKIKEKLLQFVELMQDISSQS